jgi:DNA polymerase III gamma/tau subunit
LPTIRSRCLQFHFAPVPTEEVEAFLAEHDSKRKASERKTPSQRKLAAQLSAGSPGAGLSMDVEESTRLRKSVLHLLERAIEGKNYSEIFAMTAQLAKQEQESFENVLTLIYSFLTDLLESSQGPKSILPRNPDLRREIETLGHKINWEWILRATCGLDELEGRLRRNIGRQLGLDALTASMNIR